MKFTIKQSKMLISTGKKIWFLRFWHRLRTRRRNLTIFLFLLFLIFSMINIFCGMFFVLIILACTVYDYFDHKNNLMKYLTEWVTYRFSNSDEINVIIEDKLTTSLINTTPYNIDFGNIYDFVEGKVYGYDFISFYIKSDFTNLTFCSDQFSNTLEYNDFVLLLKSKIN